MPGASTVRVDLLQKDEHIQLKIHDDGCGFDLDEIQHSSIIFKGIGLTNMRERLELVSGEFKIESKVGEGTTLIGTVPIDGSF